jgi:capsular exopolysaccharide synthesis family protein
MSRIQNILAKAEREGSVRRMRGPDPAPAVTAFDDAAVIVPAATVPIAPAIPLPATTAIPSLPLAAMPVIDDRVQEQPAQPVSPSRIVTNARLDRRVLAATATDSMAAEQYRALRTRMLHTDNGNAVHVVLITSPGRAEGKTLTAANLALTMAQEYQRRICLVDADMRYPQLHRLFGLPDGPGLSDVLSGQVALEDALVTIEDQQITILPAGRAHGRPAELLGTTTMRRTLEALRTQFDRVLVDAPAAAPLADVGILTPLVDSVLLVVRAGVTVRPAIHDAVASIDPSKLLGVVLNEAA